MFFASFSIKFAALSLVHDPRRTRLFYSVLIMSGIFRSGVARLRMLLIVGLLVVLAVFQAGGPCALFHSQRRLIQSTASERIAHEEEHGRLVLLKIPRQLIETRNPLFRAEHEREFCYLGKMYDVARAEARADTMWYWCVHDERETELVAHLHQWARAFQRLPPCDSRPIAGLAPQWSNPVFFPPRIWQLAAFDLAFSGRWEPPSSSEGRRRDEPISPPPEE